MHFLAGINTKYFRNIPEEKYFASVRILNLFIKYFANPFVDIALSFCDSFFNTFWFEAIPSFYFFKFIIKICFFVTKLAMSFLLAKYACANLAVKLSAVKLSNSWVVIYWSWSWSVITLFLISLIFVL